MKYEVKEKSLKMKKLFTNTTYYKLQDEKHFVYYIIGMGSKGYRVGGVEEILDQALMIPRVCRGWKTVGKKPKLVARTGLRSSQRHGSTMTNAMKSDLPDTVRDVMQANHRNGAPGIGKSHRVLRSWLKAFELSS